MSTWPHARKTAVRLGPGCLLLAGALATAWLGLSLFSPICAAEPLGGPTLSAADLVQEALGAESDGRSGDFARWSHEALARSPDLPAAHWLAGQVTLGGGWVKAEEASKLLATDKNYQEYLRLRAKYADKVVDQFRLGQWCSDRKLTEQARTTSPGSSNSSRTTRPPAPASATSAWGKHGAPRRTSSVRIGSRASMRSGCPR